MKEEQPNALAEDLVFGDVQIKQTTQQQIPPSDNGHYAVQSVPPQADSNLQSNTVSAKPRTSTTAPTSVFVDLDTMLDMQEHAAEDTSVELGGVLLGYRGLLQDGTPYVVINDSLRARHYKATRGSFTFTHETWADLNQRRAALPETTEIVGWYHTHPGWSVFLSDMDVFICDHFFAHPDDVALVIDPTSGDTGLFVRRGAPAKRAPQRLSTYFLYAHRKCRDSLAHWAHYFSGGVLMSSPNAVFPGRSSTPVIVSTPANDASANRMMILLGAGLICSQLLLGIMFFASTRNPASTTQPTTPGALQAHDLQAREAIVDQLLSQIAIDGPASVSQTYRELAVQNSELRAANLGLMTRIQSLESGVQQAAAQNQKIMLELETVRERLAAAKLNASQSAATSEHVGTDSLTEPAATAWWRSTWFVASISATVAAIFSGLGVFYFQRQDMLKSHQ